MRLKLALLTLVIILLVTACGPGETPTPAPILPTDAPTQQPTTVPTEASPLAILLIPTDMDAETSNEYQTLVYNLAQQAGMRFQVRNTLSSSSLEPGLKVVIALPPDPGIAELAAAAPQVQFLAVNIPDLTAGGNLSVLAPSARLDIQAFLAGYIAAMITQDYHLGMVIPQNDAVAANALQAFTNGMEYYCGLCNPWAGPFYDYPLWVEIPDGTPLNEYNAYVNYLVRYQAETLFIYPGLADMDMLTYASTNGVLMIGTFTPTKKLNSWVASIQPDMLHAIESAWPDLVAGNGGKDVPSPLTLTDLNPEFFSAGKQRLAEDLLADLVAGRVVTGVNP